MDGSLSLFSHHCPPFVSQHRLSEPANGDRQLCQMSINHLYHVRRCPCWTVYGQRKHLHCVWGEGETIHMEERLKLDVSFPPLLCQLMPGSFVITSSSPSLYIFCSHIKARVLKLCSLDSVFLIHAGMPVSVWYSISAAHHTPRSHLEGFVWVVLRDQSAFSFFFYWSCCICSLLTLGDHWLSSSNQIRHCGFGFVWRLFCAPYRWGQAGFHTCLKSLENAVLWELRGGFQLVLELSRDEPAWPVLVLKSLAECALFWCDGDFAGFCLR